MLGAPRQGRARAASLAWLSGLNQRVLWRAYFLQNCIQMSERFIHRKRIHFPAMLIGSGLNGCFQEMPGCLNSQRVSYDPASTLVVLHPRWMRQSDPYRPAAGKKLYVD